MNLLLILFAIAGHATLWITLVNRLHARPWPEQWLRSLRHVHDAFLLGFPPILLLGAGLMGPRLLLDGKWSDAFWLWHVLFGICWLGGIRLIYVSARHMLTRNPAQLSKEEAHFIDIAAEFGRRPVDEGPYQFMAKLPLNEQFRVQVTQKTLALKNLPAELDGLTIWHISDWHFSGTIERTFFERVVMEMNRKPADLVCFTGDLIDRMKCVDWLESTLGSIQASEARFFILGNHDWNKQPDPIRQRLTDLGWIDVSSRSMEYEVRGIQIVIGGDETPWMGTRPDFSMHDNNVFRLLMSHTPDNFDFARQQSVDLMLAGHTHGGQVQLPLIGPVYSPSKHGCKYSSGTFFEAPTLMHVSRGLAGIHPLRWRCPPEITRLTLKRG
ncbi:MAG: metallophosphoesterase [Planctomycetaceae bacterium]|nr:metallophosphoesterase [Planctomycetaceae bacterium]MCB9951562.1 metallophosphoesterase [Planctomycetaceae bacterium]